jgi:mutator protein MutT
MVRIDHLDDPNAPKINSIIPAASAIIENDQGEILLHRRRDNNSWALPGGTMEFGESIAETVIREVKEETGLEVEPISLVGVYTDPNHVIEYTDGEVRQEFSLCFVCKFLSGNLQISEESHALQFFSPREIERLDMHPSIRKRIQHYQEHRQQPAID